MTAYTRIGKRSRRGDDAVMYAVSSGDIMHWIHAQSKDFWYFGDLTAVNPGGITYYFTKEMETWFRLRWS